MENENDMKDNGYYTFLLLMNTLKNNQVGGLLNSFDWKQTLKVLKEKSVKSLDKERADLQCVLDSIYAAGRRLNLDTSLTKGEVRSELEEEIKELVWELMGTSVPDFYIRKAIVIDGKYNNEEIDLFLTDRLLGEQKKKIVAGFIKSTCKYKDVQFKESFIQSTPNDEDFVNPFLTFIILDLITDGVLDGNFINETYSSDEIEYTNFSGDTTLSMDTLEGDDPEKRFTSITLNDNLDSSIVDCSSNDSSDSIDSSSDTDFDNSSN